MEPAALRMTARYAAGSLRDAENLLEQLVVSNGGSGGSAISLGQVEQLLGMGNDEGALELVKYLLMGNTTASLSAVNRAAWEGSDLRQLHRQTSDLLRGFMHLQWGAEEAVDLPDHVAAQLKEMVGNLPPWRIIKALKIWGAVNMRYEASSTLPLELAAVEICEDTAAPEPEPAPAAAPAVAPRRSVRESAPPPAQPPPPQQQRPARNSKPATQSPAPGARTGP